jgi:hypothetical protein
MTLQRQPSTKAVIYTPGSTLHQTEDTTGAAQFVACQKQAAELADKTIRELPLQPHTG